MVNCPNCDAVIDVDEDDLDEGDTLTCDECGADLSVTGLDPLELETEEDEDEDEEEETKTSITTRTKTRMRMKRKPRKRIGTSPELLSSLLLIVLLCPASFSLQAAAKKKPALDTYAIVSGSVFDDRGYAFPDANVSVVSEAPADQPKGKEKPMEAVSDARGEFVVHVPPGPAHYSVTVEAKGYQSQAQEREHPGSGARGSNVPTGATVEIGGEGNALPRRLRPGPFAWDESFAGRESGRRAKE